MERRVSEEEKKTGVVGTGTEMERFPLHLLQEHILVYLDPKSCWLFGMTCRSLHDLIVSVDDSQSRLPACVDIDWRYYFRSLFLDSRLSLRCTSQHVCGRWTIDLNEGRMTLDILSLRIHIHGVNTEAIVGYACNSYDSSCCLFKGRRLVNGEYFIYPLGKTELLSLTVSITVPDDVVFRRGSLVDDVFIDLYVFTVHGICPPIYVDRL